MRTAKERVGNSVENHCGIVLQFLSQAVRKRIGIIQRLRKQQLRNFSDSRIFIELIEKVLIPVPYMSACCESALIGKALRLSSAIQ